MTYRVNENCIGCGLCCELCPAVFSMTAAGVSAAAPGPVDAGEEDAAVAAMEGCPVGAIEQNA